MGRETSAEPVDDMGAADWSMSAIPDFRGRVIDLVTETFPAYVRIFHRPDQGLPGSDGPSRWAAIAEDRGTVFHPAAQFTDLARESSRPEAEQIPGPPRGIHSEIDYDTTVVGGTPSLIQALVDDPEIEALQVDGHVSLTANGDGINGSYPSGWSNG